MIFEVYTNPLGTEITIMIPTWLYGSILIFIFLLSLGAIIKLTKAIHDRIKGV